MGSTLHTAVQTAVHQGVNQAAAELPVPGTLIASGPEEINTPPPRPAAQRIQPVPKREAIAKAATRIRREPTPDPLEQHKPRIILDFHNVIQVRERHQDFVPESHVRIIANLERKRIKIIDKF